MRLGNCETPTASVRKSKIPELKQRKLIHFAVDTECVRMTTRLAGDATHFLPFNKGCDGGAGNPHDPAGRGYRTAYLWEEVLARDSLLNVPARLSTYRSKRNATTTAAR